MNKYSKRALKTTATVGMSLAMVLSGVAAPLTNVKAAAEGCITAEAAQVTKLNVFINNNAKWKEATATTTFTAEYYKTSTKFDELGKAISADGTSVKDAKYPAKITVNGTELSLVYDATLTTTEKTGDGTAKYFYAKEEAATTEVLYVSEKVKVNTIDYINGELTAELEDKTVLSDTDVTKAATKDKLKIVTENAADFYDALKAIEEGCSVDVTNNAKDLLNLGKAVSTTTTKALIALANDGEINEADQYDAIETFLTKYDANLSDSQKEILAIELERLGEGDMNSSTDEYQTSLSKYLDKETTKLEKMLADSDYTSLDVSAKAITSATVDSMLKTLKDTTDYKRFKKEGAVLDLVAEIEALKDDVKTVTTAVDRVKNESYKEYVSGGTSSVSNKVSKIDYTIKDGITGNKLTISNYEILKAFKEDVVDVVFTMEAKEVGNRWVDKSSQSAFVTDTQFDKVMKDFGKLSTFNSETGEYAWNVLEAHMDKVVTSLKALDSLAKLDAVTLQAGDRATLVAADDAVYFLQGDAKDNLTSAETRTVRDAARKVTELMETYRVKFGSIDTTVNGWVNKGNGDWTYYENGSAVTKWVAAGTNWFYVKDGNMLRNSWVANNSTGSKWYYVNNEGQMVSNTTVNGYVFDANGVWVK